MIIAFGNEHINKLPKLRGHASRVHCANKTQLLKCAILMTLVLRIAYLKIAHHVCNPEVGKHEGNHGILHFDQSPGVGCIDYPADVLRCRLLNQNGN